MNVAMVLSRPTILLFTIISCIGLHVLGSIATLRIIPKERLLKERLYKSGDYMIGGLFPVHHTVSQDRKTCVKFSEKGISWLQAFLFAIDTINNSSDILPNITLGYDIRDDCNQVDRAVEAAYDFVSGRKFIGDNHSENGSYGNDDKPANNIQQYSSNRQQSCSRLKRIRTPSVIAVVGSASSVVSGTVANILGVEHVPQISYAATSRWLSDKKRYRSFFRTIPSDDFQVKVIVDLVNYFNWTYLSTLATDSAYGELSAQVFDSAIKKQQVCVAVRHVLPQQDAEGAVGKFVEKLKSSEEGRKSTVVLGFLPEHDTPSLLKEINNHRLKGKTFIAAESWADNDGILHQSPDIVQGILGVVSSAGAWPEVVEYVKKSSIRKLVSRNHWLKEYLENLHGCKLNSSDGEESCGETFSQMSHSAIFGNLFTNAKMVNVINAVYSIAYALHDMTCVDYTCQKAHVIHKDLFSKIQNVSFESSGGTVSFDSNGDVRSHKYIITNVQEVGSQMKFVEVGSWDGKLKIDQSKIVWNGGSRSPPLSVCSDDCLPGYRIMYGLTKCCWTCALCHEGFFTNSSNQETCMACASMDAKGWTNNTDSTGCVQLPVEYLNRSDGLAIAAYVLSLALFLTDIFCLAVFVRYRDTPVVKGSNKELTILLLVALGLCFLIPFLYIGEPNNMICKIQPNVFGFVYTVCISVMFTKTRRILVVFSAKMSSLLAIHSERRRAEQKQVLLLVTMTLVEGSIVGMATYLLSPTVTYDYEPRRVILDCGFNWLIIHLIAMSYTCLIAITCTFLAFKARKLPEAFNEARSTSFTMFMMVLVWIGSVPAYLGSRGKARTAWFCFTAILAALPMLLFLIVPKVRIILFYPEKNRADVVRTQTSNHILTKAVRRTSSVSLANSGSISTQLRRRSNTAGSTDSGTMMIQARQHGKVKRQVSATESQVTETRRFSNVSEHSVASSKTDFGCIGNDATPRNYTVTDDDGHAVSKDTRL